MKAVFVSYAFPPQAAPRAVQVARLAKFSALPIRILCAGAEDAASAARPGVEVMRFPDRSSRLRRLVQRFVYQPDSERPWADRLADAVLARHLVGKDDVLVTFGQPMSDHLVGLAVKRAIGMPWIAHFSDPWSDNPYGWRDPLSRRRVRAMEHDVIAAADLALFTSAETVDLVMRKYPAEWRGKARVLAHAFDPEAPSGEAMEPAPEGTLVLRHLGNFYGRRNPLLFIRALKLLLRTRPAALEDVRIELIGRWVGHEGRSSSRFDLPETLLTFRKSIPYEDSLRAMRSAAALLIIDAPFERNVFFPSKLVDYLWARRPVLALTPPGTSARIVAEAGGMTVVPDTPESVASGLENFLTRLRAGRIAAPNEAVVARYDARPIAREFDTLVGSVSRLSASRGEQAVRVGA